MPGAKRLAYQDLYPSEGTAGYYICRLFTPTGEQFDLGDASQALHGDKPYIVKNLDFTKNKYVDKLGRVEGVDSVRPGDLHFDVLF